MGLISTAFGLQTYIPFDCHQETSNIFGLPEGNRVSDKDLLSGLSVLDHELV
jgi:hypothetical protein